MYTNMTEAGLVGPQHFAANRSHPPDQCKEPPVVEFPRTAEDQLRHCLTAKIQCQDSLHISQTDIQDDISLIELAIPGLSSDIIVLADVFEEIIAKSLSGSSNLCLHLRVMGTALS